MEKNCEINIEQVGNGFIIRPFQLGSYQNREFVTARTDIEVFQTFNELTTWLSAHFSHRNGGSINVDE